MSASRSRGAVRDDTVLAPNHNRTKIISNSLHMRRLDRISMAELLELLAMGDEDALTQRILAAIAYKQGDSRAAIAKRHYMNWKTVDN